MAHPKVLAIIYVVLFGFSLLIGYYLSFYTLEWLAERPINLLPIVIPGVIIYAIFIVVDDYYVYNGFRMQLLGCWLHVGGILLMLMLAQVIYWALISMFFFGVSIAGLIGIPILLFRGLSVVIMVCTCLIRPTNPTKKGIPEPDYINHNNSPFSIIPLSVIGGDYDLDGHGCVRASGQPEIGITFNRALSGEIALKTHRSLCHHLKVSSSSIGIQQRSDTTSVIAISNRPTMAAFIREVSPYVYSDFSRAKLEAVGNHIGVAVPSTFKCVEFRYMTGTTLSDGQIYLPNHTFTPYVKIGGSDKKSMEPTYIEFMEKHLMCASYTSKGVTTLRVNDTESNTEIFRDIARIGDAPEHMSFVAICGYSMNSIRHQFEINPYRGYGQFKEPMQQLGFLLNISRFVGMYEYHNGFPPVSPTYGRHWTENTVLIGQVQESLRGIHRLFFQYPIRDQFVVQLIKYLKTQPKYLHIPPKIDKNDTQQDTSILSWPQRSYKDFNVIAVYVRDFKE